MCDAYRRLATGKVAARYLAMTGFTLFVITFRYAANVTTLDMTFTAASWLRVDSDDAHPLLLHLHHHGGLCRHAQGAEQPGGRPHQLRRATSAAAS